MRKPRDGEDTRQRVLSAAQRIFAAKGFSATSLADISKLCGISDGLILHHFQNKQNLYLQVQERLSDQYSSSLAEARASSTTPHEMMRNTMIASFNYWKQDTTYQRVSDWAYLEGQNGFLEKETNLVVGLAQCVKQLQEQGFFEDHYSPVVLLTMVIGPIKFWLRYRDLFKKSLDLTETLDELDNLFLSQLMQLIISNSQKSRND